MGFFRTTGKILAVTAKLGGRLAAGTLKASSAALNGSAKFVANHQHEISGVTRAAVGVTGKTLMETGSAIAIGADAVARGLHRAGAGSKGNAGKILGHAAGYTANAISLTGRVAGGVGSVTQKASPVIGGATGSAVSGVVRTLSGAIDAVAISESDFMHLHQRLQKASADVRAISDRRLAAIEIARQERRGKDLLDLLVVGGVTLAEIVRDPAKVPADVERAFELAYPGLARIGRTFAEEVNRLSATKELVGFVNGVKGKLFEIELVEHLNAGNLPDGVHAELAGSATQPGYDIKIVDADGYTIDVLQAKATESATYVKDALNRYPDIDVTTTTEVHAKLVAIGVGGRIANSGISEAVLQQKVEAAAAAGDDISASDFAPSSIGLAVIALSSFVDKSLSPEQRGGEFGDRAAKASVTGAAAKAVLVATNTWWLGLAVGVSSRWLASYGGDKRRRYEALQRVVDTLEGKVKASEDLFIASSPLSRLAR